MHTFTEASETSGPSFKFGVLSVVAGVLSLLLVFGVAGALLKFCQSVSNISTFIQSWTETINRITQVRQLLKGFDKNSMC